MKTKHLDLGCGPKPKNPYQKDEVFGCDIIPPPEDLGGNYLWFKQVNLTLENIPYPDNYFDSVSAFDFLEHVPRQAINLSGKSINPFVNLMSEIYRVLKPGGVFFASTPAYPHPSVFSDPTHVNFITDATHEYFIGQHPTASIYGFVGSFYLIYSRWDTPHNADVPNESPIRKSLRRIHRKTFKGGLSHMFWEFSANKPRAA